MANVPEFYKHLDAMGRTSMAQPFEYRAETGLFVIGHDTLELYDFDPDLYFPDDELATAGIPVEEMPQHAALIPTAGGIIGGPKLHAWVMSHPKELAATHKVMVDAFVAIDPTISEALRKESVLDHTGFCSGLDTYDNLTLIVAGNCACLGSIPEGGFIDRGDAGFAQYELHNTDLAVQRISLYAGFGHIARLASEA